MPMPAMQPVGRELTAVEDYRSLVCGKCEAECSRGLDKTQIFSPEDYLGCGGLTRDLSDAQLAQLMSGMRARSVRAGEAILGEGSVNNQIYLLLHGEVSIRKRGEDEDAKREFEISRLQKGAFFGELSWLDSRPASATVTAVGDCEIAALPVDELPSELRSRLALNIARGIAERLRDQNDAHVQSLAREAAELRMRNLFGRFYIVTMVLFGILTVLPIYLPSARATGLSQMFHSWAALLTLLLPMIYFLRRAKLPASTFGLTLRGSRRALLEGTLVIAVLATVMFTTRWITREAGEPFFNWGKTQGYTAVTLAIYLTVYPLHSFLQELIARGVLQGALQIFLGDIHYLVPSAVVSILFGIAHLQYGISAAGLTFAVGIIFGVMYYRQKTLVGVTLIHSVAGILAMAVGWI